jgi:hypothetical protein
VNGGDRNGQTAPGVAIGKASGLFDEKQPTKVYSILIKGKMVEQARSFGDSHLRAVLHWLRDVDVGVKTGRVDPSKSTMQLLCVRIVHGPDGSSDRNVYAAA